MLLGSMYTKEFACWRTVEKYEASVHIKNGQVQIKLGQRRGSTLRRDCLKGRLERGKVLKTEHVCPLDPPPPLPTFLKQE
jgi:hypothetical protein